MDSCFTKHYASTEIHKAVNVLQRIIYVSNKIQDTVHLHKSRTLYMKLLQPSIELYIYNRVKTLSKYQTEFIYNNQQLTTHLANDLLTGGTTPQVDRLLVPTLAARGEKAKALADVAARASKATFFMINIVLLCINTVPLWIVGLERTRVNLSWLIEARGNFLGVSSTSASRHCKLTLGIFGYLR